MSAALTDSHDRQHPSSAAIGSLLLLSFRSPSEAELYQLTRDWRARMGRHHGVIVPRRTLDLLVSHVMEHSKGTPDLAKCLDLLDDVMIAYKQSLLTLTASAGEYRRMRGAFIAVAVALANISSGSGEDDLLTGKESARQGVALAALRDLNRTVASSGGPRSACSVKISFVRAFIEYELLMTTDPDAAEWPRKA